MLHISISRTSPHPWPLPHLLQAFHKRWATPQSPERDSTAQGRELPHQHRLQTGSLEQSQAWPPYRSSRYFRYSEQSCWVPGLNQGVQDADRKFSGEMAGRCIRSGRDGSGAGGPLTSQLPAPQRAGTEGHPGESLPQTPSLPIHSQLSIPADFSHPTKSMPPKSMASGPWRGTVLQDFPCLLPFPLPETPFPLSEA